MFKVIHPNRWFIWTLVILLGASLILMFLIQDYLLEVEQGVFENTPYPPTFNVYNWDTFGLSVRYPASWQIETEGSGLVFYLQNPINFSENISFSVTKPEYESIIRESLKIASEENIAIDGRQGVWLKGGDSKDLVTSNVILIESSGILYQIMGYSEQFERIVRGIKFSLPLTSPP